MTTTYHHPFYDVSRGAFVEAVDLHVGDKLQTGDVAFFAGGTWASWRVDNYVRKVAFLRKPFPKPLAIAYRLRNLLRNNGGNGIAA